MFFTNTERLDTAKFFIYFIKKFKAGKRDLCKNCQEDLNLYLYHQDESFNVQTKEWKELFFYICINVSYVNY